MLRHEFSNLVLPLDTHCTMSQVLRLYPPLTSPLSMLRASSLYFGNLSFWGVVWRHIRFRFLPCAWNLVRPEKKTEMWFHQLPAVYDPLFIRLRTENTLDWWYWLALIVSHFTLRATAVVYCCCIIDDSGVLVPSPDRAWVLFHPFAAFFVFRSNTDFNGGLYLLHKSRGLYPCARLHYHGW